MRAERKELLAAAGKAHLEGLEAARKLYLKARALTLAQVTAPTGDLFPALKCCIALPVGWLVQCVCWLARMLKACPWSALRWHTPCVVEHALWNMRSLNLCQDLWPLAFSIQQIDQWWCGFPLQRAKLYALDELDMATMRLR